MRERERRTDSQTNRRIKSQSNFVFYDFISLIGKVKSRERVRERKGEREKEREKEREEGEGERERAIKNTITGD